MITILVIEDEFSVLEILEEMLTSEKFNVLTAEDGQQGVALANQFVPDLILCDIMMPHMNGYEVLQTLREYPKTQTIPFIFLTAKTAKLDQRYGMDLGADDYLNKPFSREELIKGISSRLKRHQLQLQKSEEKLQALRLNLMTTLPHELKTPLNNIMLSADVLASMWKTISANNVREIADTIKSSACRLNQLIQKFSFYAKLELLSYHPQDLKDFLKGQTLACHFAILSVIEDRGRYYQRSFDIESDLAHISVKVSEVLLIKIVSELLDNAFKFSQKGQKITVKTYEEDKFMRLIISDQGRGMTADQIKNIGAYMQFDRQFYEQQGTGLGLVISQRLTHFYGGDFQIKSEIDQGTTITLTLPLLKESEISEVDYLFSS